MVEMALVLPVLLLLIIGSIEFGLLFHERLTIASAASSAARTGTKLGPADSYGYVGGSGCKWDPCPDLAADGPVGSWLPSSRDTILASSGGGLDVLGVEIRYHHRAVSGMIPGIDRDITERALVRLEPSSFGTSP